MDTQRLIQILKDGGVAVMPTDTIYGIVGRAENPETVERIYKIRKRPPDKPCIILIADISELEKFSISLSDSQRKILEENNSEPTSFILDCEGEALAYLHRGTNTLAFRIPKQQSLIDLLNETGPLIAPSANPSGLSPATTIAEARGYFGDQIDFYQHGGELPGKPSKIIRLHNDGSVEIIRK